MSKHVFKLPDIGEGVVEGEVVQWHVAAGDTVSEDDPIVDVMTDKATVTIPSPVSGVVTLLSGDVGEMVPVGSTLVEFDSELIDRVEGLIAAIPHFGEFAGLSDERGRRLEDGYTWGTWASAPPIARSPFGRVAGTSTNPVDPIRVDRR